MQTRKRQRSPTATSGLKCSADTCSEVSNQTLQEQKSPSRNKTQLCQELGLSSGLNTGKVLRLFVPCPPPGVTALPSCTHAAEPAKPERASHHHLCRSLQPSHYSAEPPNVPNPLIIPSPWKKAWEALLFWSMGSASKQQTLDNSQVCGLCWLETNLGYSGYQQLFFPGRLLPSFLLKVFTQERERSFS